MELRGSIQQAAALGKPPGGIGIAPKRHCFCEPYGAFQNGSEKGLAIRR